MRRLLGSMVVIAAVSLAGCGYNDIQRKDEETKSAWAQVLNQYQRRADLVPNLVETVKGAAASEQQILTQVVEARARATSIQVTPETLNNPEALKRFQDAQAGLSSALSRLLAVVENYPDLKSQKTFQDLMAQLEGTENRISTERGRYIKTVNEYNVLVRQFPVNLTAMVFGYPAKPNFAVENESAISTSPKIDFGKKPEPAK